MNNHHNLASVGLWSTSTIDISVTAQVFKEMSNLLKCLEFLVNLNSSQAGSESSFLGGRKHDSPG